MEKLELQVELRQGAGKGAARRLRETSKVPAVFYGPHLKSPISLSIGEKDVMKVVRSGSNVLLTLRSAGNSSIDGKMALLKDEEIHPVSRKYIHVDLYEIRMDEKLKVKIPVALVGKAKGVGEGGILEQVTRELEIRCLPTEIPDRIEVDVSSLDIGMSLHISDIKLPKGVTVVADVDYTLASVVPPEAEEVAAPAPTAEAVAGAAAPGAAPAAGAPAAPGAAPAAGAKAAPGAAPAAGGKAPAAPAADKAKGGEAKK